MPPVLSLRGVGKTYVAGRDGCRGAARALDGVDLDVHAGEIVEVVGARGAGKSTLLLCAAGLVQPDRGSVSWPAAPIATPHPIAAGYAAYAAAGAPWQAALESELARLVLLDGCLDRGGGGRGALDAWLAWLSERGVSSVVASRAPRLGRATRLVVMARGRIMRDVPRERAVATRVAERDAPRARGSIDRDSGVA